MWVFTEVADWFDKQRKANAKFLDQEFQGWVDYAVKHEDEKGFVPALRNAMIYTGVGTAFALNTLTSSVAAGFVDVARIGDGVKKGGWGYGEDALRLLSLGGPVAKMAGWSRRGLATLASVDPDPTAGHCTWVAAAKALRLTGVKHFASVRQIFEASGLKGAADVTMIAPALRKLGASVRTWVVDSSQYGMAVGHTNTVVAEEVLTKALQGNQRSVAIFSVWWRRASKAALDDFAAVPGGTAAIPEGDLAGHSMVAFRTAEGGIRILDRSGRMVSSLAELDDIYPGIKAAEFDPWLGAGGLGPTFANIALIDEATVVTVLQNGAKIGAAAAGGLALKKVRDGYWETDSSWVQDAVGLEIRSVPFRVETRRTLVAPARVAPAKREIRKQTFCIQTQDESNVSKRICQTSDFYTVQEGDTLVSIALLAYHDQRMWSYIHAYNQETIGKDPDAIKPGMVLGLPTP